ncbi:hypothetical protein [Hydrogenophaga sp.]|uniref:hypothetical protein n=1 Tax=Hydrogenophaga sp. TaxID=1904254 RepID=UPI003D0B18D9
MTQIREHLLGVLGDLRAMGRDGKALDPEQVKAQVARANAMKGVGDTLIESAKVEVDYIRATGAPKSDFLEPAVAALPRPSETPTPHNPFPVSVRHTLEG